MASKQQPKQKSKLETLRERSVQAEQGGGVARVEKQHEAGKMTARERVEFLLDEGSFEEFDKLVVHRSKTSDSTSSSIPETVLLRATV